VATINIPTMAYFLPFFNMEADSDLCERARRLGREYVIQAKGKVIPASIKVPPHNLEAEEAILGGILINNEAMNQVLDILTAEAFYREAHAQIFEGMTQLYNNNEPIDLITLSQYLIEKNLLEKIGGAEYLGSLVEAVSTSAGILYHAQIVRDLSVRRRLITQCSTISESCFGNWQKTDELLDMAEQSIFDIAEDKIHDSFSTMEDVIKGSFRKLESVAEHDGFVTGIPSGLSYRAWRRARKSPW